MSKNLEFFQKVNESFMKGDVDFLIENIAPNIEWYMVGEQTIVGKENVREMLEPMRGVVAEGYETKKIITHGDTAAIEGTMKMPDENGEIKSYAFCDIYKLDKFKGGKIKEMTAFVIEDNR
ncbi:nuclear transport factor 2 family protein [Ornithinibacillus sp. L9]|uniref:Nuclear transport factor 2 family protein n=1 Tax=Ornithinibacillus caprae TaxID=2678566 RepID=A0A6N8FIV1_9BACI|nr:nuclear transport factor 2 family protein [Ornithinibacillus caprae]MUK88606.1 nuclear transport factor 2 family protein [Ornithinibacillus caprae]